MGSPTKNHYGNLLHIPTSQTSCDVMQYRRSLATPEKLHHTTYN